MSGPGFDKLKFTLGNTMKERAVNSVRNNVKKAEVLTFTDEDLLWSLGLLGLHSPQASLDTNVFKLDFTCSLCVSKGHRLLHSTPCKFQFEFLNDSSGNVFLRYTENFSLNTNKRGLKHRNLGCKAIDVYYISDVSRCPIRLLMKYLSMLPKKPRVTQALYLQPRKKFTPRNWCLGRPVGANTLRDTVKELSIKAGLPGYYITI